MEYEEFRKLVKYMRTAQTRYFKTRSFEDLRISKSFELIVDDMLTPNLFTEYDNTEKSKRTEI